MTLFLSHLGPGDGVIDGGANVGNMTRLYDEAVGPTGCVVAVEPDPRSAGTLRHAAHQWPSVRVVEAALTAGLDDVVLLHADIDRKRNSLWAVNVLTPSGDLPVRVPATTLDAIAAGVPRLRGIKLDLQGGESDALDGATALLQRPDLVWFVEMWHTGLCAAGRSVRHLVDQFARAGWTCLEHDWATVIAKAEAQRGHGAIDVTVAR
jgi:FkbM family methyltransferase